MEDVWGRQGSILVLVSYRNTISYRYRYRILFLNFIVMLVRRVVVKRKSNYSRYKWFHNRLRSFAGHTDKMVASMAAAICTQSRDDR